MRIKLHIGFHKCGSSAVQVGMARSRALFADRGVCYPAVHSLLDGHHRLAWALSGAKKANLEPIVPEALLAAWFAEAAEQNAEIMVLSSEEFEFLQPAAVRRLRALLEGHEVEIYAYVRPQDEYFVSEYKQHVRMAETAFSDPIAHFYYRHQLNGRFNYFSLMNRWALPFGNDHITIGSYHRPGLKNQDMLADFIEAAGLPEIALPESRDANVSWSNLTSVIMAKLNRLGIAAGKREPLAAHLDRIARQRGPDIELLDAAARAAFMTSYRLSNQKLLAEFRVRGDAGRLLERPLSTRTPEDPEAAVNQVLLQFVAEIIRK